MSTRDLIKKSESVLTTVNKIVSDFDAIYSTVHQNRRTRSQNGVLLESILPKLSGLEKQLKTLKSQAMDVDNEARSHTLSSATISANQQAVHQITNDPVMDTLSEDIGNVEGVPTRDEQHNGAQMGNTEQEVPQQSLVGEKSPAQHAKIPDGQLVIQSADTLTCGTGSDDELTASLIPLVGGAEGTEDSNGSQPTQLPSREDASHASAEVATNQPATINGANQLPIAPTTTRNNPTVSLNTGPESSTRASSCTPVSSCTASDTSPASSKATDVTWPDRSSRECSPATTMPAEHNEQIRPSSAGSPNAATSRCERTANNRLPQVIQDSQVTEDTLMGDPETTASLPLQIHSPEGDTENQHTEPSPAPNLSSDGGDLGGEGAGLDIGTENTIPTSTITARSTLPTITLPSTDMDRLVDKLGELARDHTLPDSAKQHLSVPHRTVNLTDMENRINTHAGKLQYTSIRYDADPNGKGDTRVRASHKVSDMDWSGFTAETKRPTIEEAKKVFETNAQNPPEEEIPYYVGHVNILRDTPPNPGPLITGNPDLKDLHTPYDHIGGHLSANRMHNEDLTFKEETAEGAVFYGLRSYNEVYFGTGFKLWLVIKKHHIAKFDRLFRANWECSVCDHALSHEDILFPPSILERAGIEYDIAVVGCGEAFWTLPGQQHQVINFGYCAAVSINFALPEDKLDLKKSIHCSRCGMFEVAKKRGATIVPALSSKSSQSDYKRKADQEMTKSCTKRMTRTTTWPERDLKGIKDGLIAKDINYRSLQPELRNPSTEQVSVYRRVAAVRSTLAIQQFIDLVREWRQQQSQPAFVMGSSLCVLDQAIARVKHYTGRTMLDRFCLRLAKMRLTQAADKERRPGQKHLDQKFLQDLASRNRVNRETLKADLRDGGEWKKVCGQYDGLLAFILLDKRTGPKIGKKEWTWLSHEANIGFIEAFHDLLDDDYTKNLCDAGKVFEEILSGASKVFVWEESELDPAAADIEVQLKRCKTIA